MASVVRQEQLKRLKEKHADGLLLWELKNGFELSPRESDLVLETAKGILLEVKTLERGKHRVVGVTLGMNFAHRQTSVMITIPFLTSARPQSEKRVCCVR